MRNIDEELKRTISENPGLGRSELVAKSPTLQANSKQYIGLRLRELVKQGIIRKEGEKKGTKYFPHSPNEPADSNKLVSSTRIIQVFDEVKRMVVAKNQAYGDSVFEPMRVFYKGGAQPADLIRIRMDDKISRLIQGSEGIENDEDVIKDLMGYCAILLVAMRQGQTRLDDFTKSEPSYFKYNPKYNPKK
jgi:hypothetical protein